MLRNLFDESERANAKDWINHRYGWLLASEEWAFLEATDSVTVTSGSMAVTGVATDFGIALALHDSDGKTLEGIPDPTEFYRRYQGVSAAKPEAYTVVAGSIFVGPTSNESKTDYLLVYEKKTTPLAADGDVPIIPEDFHLALVHGGRSEGMKLQHNPAWRDVEQDFLASIGMMRRRYLVGMRSESAQYRAFRPS